VTELPDAVRFGIGTYTRLPVPAPRVVDADTAGRGLALGPAVGAGIGLLSGLPLLVTGPDLLTRLLSATLVVALAAWLSRGLHWDGLADLADGLGSAAGPDRALAVMRRSDIGPFGVLTLVLTLALQVLALALLPAGAAALAGWVTAVSLGRLAVALASGPWTRPARRQGLGALVVGSVRPGLLAAAALTAGAIALVPVAADLLAWQRSLVLAPAAAAGTAAIVTRIAARRLGGSTGDVLGATCELATAAALLALVL
jgi:adenosylcobinamide-GDP ribazoletransferase